MPNNSVDIVAHRGRFGVSTVGEDRRIKILVGLAKVRIHKVPDSESLQGTSRVGAGLEEGAGVRVREELRDETRLGQHTAIVGEGGHHPTRVDGKIVWCARDGDVDEICVKFQSKFAKRDLSAMRKGTVVSRIECDGGRHGCAQR